MWASERLRRVITDSRLGGWVSGLDGWVSEEEKRINLAVWKFEVLVRFLRIMVWADLVHPQIYALPDSILRMEHNQVRQYLQVKCQREMQHPLSFIHFFN